MKLKDYIALADTVELDKEDDALIVLARDNETCATLMKGKRITVLVMLSLLLSNDTKLFEFVQAAVTYVQKSKVEGRQKGGDA